MMRDRDFNITDAARGAAITVRIVPKASRTEIACIEEDGTIKVRLTAPPVGDEANEELIRFLASLLEIDPGHIEIVAGHDSRVKLITALHIRAAEVERRVLAAVAGDADNCPE